MTDMGNNRQTKKQNDSARNFYDDADDIPLINKLNPVTRKPASGFLNSAKGKGTHEPSTRTPTSTTEVDHTRRTGPAEKQGPPESQQQSTILAPSREKDCSRAPSLPPTSESHQGLSRAALPPSGVKQVFSRSAALNPAASHKITQQKQQIVSRTAASEQRQQHVHLAASEKRQLHVHPPASQQRNEPAPRAATLYPHASQHQVGSGLTVLKRPAASSLRVGKEVTCLNGSAF